MRKKHLTAMAMAALMAATTVTPTMASVVIDGVETTDHSVGSVTSNQDSSSAVSADNGDRVTVSGDVTSNGFDGKGVDASDDAHVTVNGNVVSNGEASTGVSASDNANVTVRGDVSAKGTDSEGVVASGDSTVKVSGDVSADQDAVDANHSTVNVSGNVTSSNGNGIKGYDGSNVTVKGDVSGETSGVLANGSTVTVDGNVHGEYGDGITADEGSKVTVKGDVTGSNGIYAGVNSDVQVSGNVNAKDGMGVAADNATVTIDGNVSGETGVDVSNGGHVTVKGNVDCKSGDVVTITGTEKTVAVIEGNVTSDNSISIGATSDNAGSEIAIGGIIKNAEKGAGIYANVDVSGNLKTLPEIIVGEIEDINKVDVINPLTAEKVPDDVKQTVLDSIKYIVNTNHASMDGKGTISITKLDGSVLDQDGTKRYDVAKATETITVHINVQDGYEVSEVKAGKATLTKNADGSYSVTIPAGGGVNIEAVVKAIKNADSSDITVIDYSDDDDSTSTSSANKWSFNGTLWKYVKSNGVEARNEWQYISYNGHYDWYFFDADGFLKTGWYQDPAGNVYYLNPVSDGSLGAMKKGQVEVDGTVYTFNDGTVADIPEGALINQ